MTTAYDRLIAALRDHGCIVDENGDGRAKAQCPAHDDHNPSLTIAARRDGKGVILKCFADCDYCDVLDALNLAKADLFDDDGMRDAYKPSKSYRYSDGHINKRVATANNAKTFFQQGCSDYKSLYAVEHLGDAETVYVNEGEQAADAIRQLGSAAVATGGAERRCDLQPLAGRHIVLVVDRDEAGEKWRLRIHGELEGIAKSVTAVQSKVQTGKADAADHIAAGYGLDEFLELSPEAQQQLNEVLDGAVLLDDLRATFTNYVAFPDGHSAVAATLWTATTHAVPAFECAPRFVASSPEKRCGKTRLLDIIGGTCHTPLMTVNATVAAIFRSIGGDHPPTLIIDEADTIFGSRKVAEQNEDLRALLNAGHQRGRPALRCVGPNQIPTEFNTFCMAALAGIGRMPDTITDRGINLAMRRRASGEKVSQFRSRRDSPKLAVLRDRLAAWAAAQLDTLKAAEPEMPVEDRAADTWEPLIAIADCAGGHWPTTAREACKALVDAAGDADEADTRTTKLLSDIKQIFTEKGVPFLASKELVAALRRIEESPWDEFDYNPSKLAYRLKEFGIKSRRDPAGAVRGYSLESLTDAFSRYLRQNPSDPSETGDEQAKLFDAQKSSDASTRQKASSRQTENSVLPAFLTPLTGSDGGTAKNGTTAGNRTTCACGRPAPTDPITGRCYYCALKARTDKPTTERSYE